MPVSSVTFETAAIADVIKQAEKIAPSKGAAFDKAAGIVLQFDPSASIPLAVIRSTNLDVFCMEWVNVSEWAGEVAQWRLPSYLAAQVIGSLPIGTGKTVTLESEWTGHSEIVHMHSGKTKAKFNLLDCEYYPTWDAFDPDHMFPAMNLGGRIDQVEWAAGKSEPRLAGVYLDGENAIATDSYRLACVPLSIPDLSEPIVIPSGLLGQTLRQTGDVQVGVSENMFHVMPDQYTQMKTVIYNVDYPPVDRILNSGFDSELKVNRDSLIEIMSRATAFALGDRTASIDVYIGEGEVAVFMSNEQLGQIGDSVEVPGHASHATFRLKFTPKNIMEALIKAPNNDVTLRYNEGNPKSLLCVDGGSGYQAWVVPRTGVES